MDMDKGSNHRHGGSAAGVCQCDFTATPSNYHGGFVKKAAHRAEVWPDGDSTAKLHGNFAVSQ